MSVREAGLLLGISTQRVYQLVEAGTLTNIAQSTASKVRLSRKAVEDRKAEQEREANAR